MFKESIKMSWQNIIHNKMRSFLTVLGVLIGVTAIIGLISIVQGATSSITGQVSDMGANKVMVQVMGTPLKTGLTQKDLAELESIENIQDISPSITGMTSIIHDSKVMEDVAIQGKDDNYFIHTKDLIQSGRALNILDMDNNNRVCLIGQDVVDELFPTESPIDKTITINGVSYKVVGTLQASDGFSMTSNDNAVIIPYTTAMSLLGTGYISSVDIYMEDEALSGATTSSIESMMNTAFNGNEDGYIVTNMQSMIDMIGEMTGTLSIMLAGIAAIALVVGGIGIMNMMLVTVTERTTEIGLRKALGAKPTTIQTQFVLEALFLSLFGGVLGLIGGVVVSFIGCSLLGVDFAIAGYSVPLAIGFSAVIGLVFGYTPALKASRLNPIDALRNT